MILTNSDIVIVTKNHKWLATIFYVDFTECTWEHVTFIIKMYADIKLVTKSIIEMTYLWNTNVLHMFSASTTAHDFS